jgi:L-threonylcarbamoyladenylate synthase
MKGKISAVIDGGESKFGVESTVIAFDDEKTVRILRPGSVTAEMLSDFAENVIIDDAILNDLAVGRQAPSPGMKYKHYSPKADVKIVEGDFDAFCKYAESINTEGLYCLVFDEDNFAGMDFKFMTYGNNSSEQAHSLFARLRELDEMNAETVLVRAPQKEGVGLAVYNRLLRAAGFEVIRV